MSKNSKTDDVFTTQKREGIVIDRKSVLALGAVLFLVAFYILYQAVLKDTFFPKNAATNSEVSSVVAKVGKLIELPNEDVTLATVSDVTRLSSQPFFARAANGDKVLIYTASKKAILYRPSINKIIEVGPIAINPSASSAPAAEAAAASNSSSSRAATGSLQVMILNGTTVAGLASTTKKTLSDKFPDYTYFMGDANAKYARTKVVDLTGKNSTTVQRIAGAVNGEVVALPPGETKPATDILVIIGQ